MTFTTEWRANGVAGYWVVVTTNQTLELYEVYSVYEDAQAVAASLEPSADKPQFVDYGTVIPRPTNVSPVTGL